MIVKCDVYRDDQRGGLLKCVSAFLTFVAFDYQRQPTLVPQLDLAEEDQEAHKMALVIKESAKKRAEEFSKI